jgi:hypothetical protein
MGAIGGNRVLSEVVAMRAPSVDSEVGPELDR